MSADSGSAYERDLDADSDVLLDRADEERDSRPEFPVATGRKRGYERAAVDAFLTRAREAFDSGGSIDAADVRQIAFPLVRGGYQIASVDAALGRVEDALAARERRDAVAAEGANAWVERARDEAQVLLDRLTRTRQHRFDRVGALRYGYRPRG